MEETILGHPEYIAMLDAIGASSVFGLSDATVFGQNGRPTESVINTGIEGLNERGLAEVKNGNVNLTPDLAVAAAALTNPKSLVRIVRDTKGFGKQLVLLFAGEFIVEHTLPAESQFRIMIYRDRESVTSRFHEILPIANNLSDTDIVADESIIKEVFELVKNNDDSQPLSLFNQVGLNHEQGLALIEAIKNPVYTATAEFGHLDNRKIRTRTMTVLQGKQSAWMMRQVSPNDSKVFLSATSSDALFNEIKDTLYG